MAFLRRLSPRRQRRGNAMVEMALILPLLVMLIFGIIEYGWMYYRLAQINLASRNGVRAGVRPAADQAEVVAAVNTVMSGAGWSSGQYTVSTSPISVEVGEPVTVSVEVSYANVGFGLLPYFVTPAVLDGTATMAKEGEE